MKRGRCVFETLRCNNITTVTKRSPYSSLFDDKYTPSGTAERVRGMRRGFRDAERCLSSMGFREGVIALTY